MLLWMVALSFRLFATIDTTGPYPVELVWELDANTDGRTTIPFTLLEAKGARVSDLEADGRSVALDRSTAPLLRGELPFASDATSVRLRYEVSGTTIPIAVPALPPAPTRPETFAATLRLPAGWHLVEAFPTGMTASGGTATVELPIVPAFVSLTLAETPPVISPPLMMDALAVALLVGLGIVGIVVLRLR